METVLSVSKASSKANLLKQHGLTINLISRDPIRTSYRGDINKDEHERTTSRRSKRRTRRGVRPTQGRETRPASPLAKYSWPVENVRPVDLPV
jgi:gentisate 1,2-dioxygenase